MECSQYVQMLSARMDGALSDREVQALEAHLAACPACRARASQLAAMHDTLKALEEIPAPEGFAQGVMDRIRAQEAAEKKIVSRFRRPQVRALAGLAACLILCAGIYQAGISSRDWDAAADQGETGYAGSAGEAAGSSLESMGRMLGAPQENENGEEETTKLAACFAMPETELDFSEDGGAWNTAEQEAYAILTLSTLPRGAEDVLGADMEWQTDEEGRSFCIVTGGQMEALMALAGEQWPEQDLAGIATNRIGAEELCAVVLADGF